MTELAPSNEHRTVEQWLAYVSPRLQAVHERIANAGGDKVALLAVTKGHPVEAAQAAHQLGLTDLGENYAQELKAKAETIEEDADGNAAVNWHFIGQLQSNKVRTIAPWVGLWQSVDRAKIAREIAKRSANAAILVQVNLSTVDHKGGCSFDEIAPLVEQAHIAELQVRGLMGVGQAGDDAATGAQFTRLRDACDRLGLPECSIGMSADLELAIECGSTMVRIGSDIFGPRR